MEVPQADRYIFNWTKQSQLNSMPCWIELHISIFNWTEFHRVGRLVNDRLQSPQTNIYANTSNAAISDPALPGMLQKKGDENRESKRLFWVAFFISKC